MTFTLNPCTITSYDWNGNFNRKIIIFFMITEMILLLLLRIITITCQKYHKNRIEDLTKGQKTSDKYQLKIENLENF